MMNKMRLAIEKYLNLMKPFLFVSDKIEFNLKSRTIWSLVLEFVVHLQNCIATTWFIHRIYDQKEEGNWQNKSMIILPLIIASLTIDLAGKVLSLKLNKKGFISILKFTNILLLQVIFISTLLPSYSGQNPLNRNLYPLLINHILTLVILSLGIVTWTYIIFSSMITVFILEGFILFNVDPQGKPPSFLYNKDLHIFTVSTSFFMMIVLIRIYKKLMISSRIYENVIKDSPIGKVVIKGREVIFLNETAGTILKKSTTDHITVEDFDILIFNRYLKFKKNRSGQILYPEKEILKRRAKSHFVRKILNLSELLEVLRRCPESALTVYTQIKIPKIGSGLQESFTNLNESLLGKEFKHLAPDTILETEPEQRETQTHQYQVQISYLDWKKYRDQFVYIQFTDFTEAQMVLEAEKNMEFKTNILNSFSHELKTPLNISKNLINLLISDEKLPKIFKEKYLYATNSSLEKLNDLIHDIVDFLKIETNQFIIELSKFSLKRLTEEVLSTLQETCKEHLIEFKFHAEENVAWDTFTDRNRLKRILLNVLGFVVKTSYSSTLEISIKKNRMGGCDLEIDKSVVNKLKTSDDNVICTNEHQNKSNKALDCLPENDFGLIISRLLLEQLLDKGLEDYILAENQGGGLYLKLATSMVPEEHLEMQSYASQKLNSPKLKTFEVIESLNSVRRIPILKSPNIIVKESSSKFKMERSCEKFNCPRILVVDDDPFNILSLAMILEKFDINVIKASNGLEAIKTLKKYQEEHDCESNYCKGIEMILMDLMMPVMNGIECTKSLISMMEQGELPKIPIIACSANDSKDIMGNCSQIGFTAFISKPVSPIVLKTHVKPLLASMRH